MGFVELVLRVAYDRRRTNEYLAMDKRDIGPVIRFDFDMLKLPHPPQDNIRTPESDGVVVSWITRVGTPLYKTITRIVDKQDSHHGTRMAKSKCRIEDLFLKELGVASDVKQWRDATPPPRRNSTPPPRALVMARVNSIDKIDGVMQSLRKISDSFTHGEAGTRELSETSDQPHQAFHENRRHPVSAKPKSIPSRRRGDVIPRLMNELRLTRKQVAENVDRAARLEREIEALRSPGEIEDSQHGLDQLTKASLELAEERRKREEVEQILADVRRECSRPRVVPEILKMIRSAI